MGRERPTGGGWHRTRRLLSQFEAPQVWFFGAGSTAFVLGTWGFHDLRIGSWLNCASWSLGLFTFNNAVEGHLPWSINLAHVLAPATTIGGAVYAGRARLVAIRDDAANRSEGGHAVVFGAGDRARELVRSLPDDQRCIVVTTPDDLDTMRSLRSRTVRVSSTTIDDAATNAPVLDAVFADTNVGRATEVYCSMGDDRTNLAVAGHLRRFLGEGASGSSSWSTDRDDRDVRGRSRQQRGPRVAIDVVDLSLSEELRWGVLPWNDAAPSFFNATTLGVRSLLDHLFRSHAELVPTPLVSSDMTLAIVGGGPIAVALAANFVTDWSMVPELALGIGVHLWLVDFSAGDVAEFDALIDSVSVPSFFERTQWTLESLKLPANAVVVAVVEDIDATPHALRTVAATSDEGRRWVACRATPSLDFIDLEGLGFECFDLDAERGTPTQRTEGWSVSFARTLQASDRVERLLRGDDDSRTSPWSDLDPPMRDRNLAAVEGWRCAIDRLGLTLRRRVTGGSSLELNWVEVDYLAQHLHESWLDCVVHELGEPAPRHPQELPWSAMLEADADEGLWSIREARKLPETLHRLGFELTYRPVHDQLTLAIAQYQYETYRAFTRTTTPWEVLSPEAVRANVESARASLVYLWRMGMRLRQSEEPRLRMLDVEAVEGAARFEHARWLTTSWEPDRWLPTSDGPDPTRYRTLLAHYDTLDESEREKDRQRIASLPVVLARVGLELVEGTTS